MQTLTEKIFKLAPPGGIFNETVIKNLFFNLSLGARNALVHRAAKHEEILQLKPGLYCLAQDYRKTELHPFSIAGTLHSPSHISLESSLSYFGLIPEGVYQVTSVTEQRSRTFNTPLGHFTFDRVPTNNPRAGVKAIKLDEDIWVFIATPLRAIADIVYLKNKVVWEKDGLKFLTDSMRIELDDLTKISMENFKEIYEGFRNKRTRDYLAKMKKELGI